MKLQTHNQALRQNSKKNSQKKNQKLKTVLFSTTLALIAGTFTFAHISGAQSTPTPYIVDASKVQAQSVLVKNLNTEEIIFSKESQKRMPLASISKLMTAITVKNMQANWKTLPPSVKLRPNAGGALTAADRAVRAGGYMKIDDLTAYMLLSSSNYAADSLTHELIPFTSFLTYMNFTAKSIGLKDSYFINGSGLTEVGKNKAHFNSEGTAEDVMTMLNVIVDKYPELAKATRTADAYIRMSSTGQKIPIENTNKLLDSMNNIFLGKTGYTDDAGGNLAIVIEKNNQYYGIVVLGSTASARFDDVAYLASLIQ